MAETNQNLETVENPTTENETPETQAPATEEATNQEVPQVEGEVAFAEQKELCPASIINTINWNTGIPNRVLEEADMLAEKKIISKILQRQAEAEIPEGAKTFWLRVRLHDGTSEICNVPVDETIASGMIAVYKRRNVGDAVVAGKFDNDMITSNDSQFVLANPATGLKYSIALTASRRIHTVVEDAVADSEKMQLEQMQASNKKMELLLKMKEDEALKEDFAKFRADKNIFDLMF